MFFFLFYSSDLLTKPIRAANAVTSSYRQSGVSAVKRRCLLPGMPIAWFAKVEIHRFSSLRFRRYLILNHWAACGM